MKYLKFIPSMTFSMATLLIRLAELVVPIITFYILYKLLLEQIFGGTRAVFAVFGIWILSSYIVIPKIHRTLSLYYLPNYFVGRVKSPAGLLSDPINLAFFGSEKSIHSAMKKAGWSRAEDLTPKTFARAAYAVLFRKSYPTAPVGNMFLFRRVQDFAYQQEVNGSPSRRHHLRFWKVPEGWRLPGGHKADWLIAATYDRGVGLNFSTGQIDHNIHEDVDIERDYVIKTLKHAKAVKSLEIVKHFTDAYHDINNGGDKIKTDGSLPFIRL